MDELISLILHGIKLAKETEPMLQRLATHQEMASRIDEICRVFLTVRERLNSVQDPNLFPQMLYHQPQQPQQQQQQHINLSNLQQEYYSRSMMDLFRQQQFMADTKPVSPPADTGAEFSGQDVSATASSSSQRKRRRKEDPEKRSVTVAAPRMGNVEIPPEDGFTWRKYGQKEILNSKFPRAYYRCTHQKLYNCPAKKQVQRLDDDPFTFEVTYRGGHTCHMSATAPSSAPPPLLPPYSPPPPVAQPPWLEFSLGGGGGAGAGPSSSGGGSRFGKETDQYLVADLANVMFNSGSSSSNSMELIFTTTSMDDKWDTEYSKKN